MPVSALQLTVLRRLDGLLQGDHAGLLPGHGSDTGEARPYVAGDDPRRIDWPVTARTGDTHVRDTISDHELELWLVVDTSASLAFGTAEHTKAEIAWAAAGAFALLASRGGNRVAAVTAGGKRTIIPPRSGRNHVGVLLAALRRPVEDGDAGDLGAALTAVRRLATRRGMVVVVSDFLDEDGSCRSASSPPSTTSWRSRSSTSASWSCPTSACSRSSIPRPVAAGTSTPARPRSARPVRGGRRGAARPTIARHLSGTGADHLVLRTDHDWVVDLVRFVGSRKARRLAAGGRR